MYTEMYVRYMKCVVGGSDAVTYIPVFPTYFALQPNHQHNTSPLVRDRCRQVKIFSLDTDDGATLRT